MAGLARKIQAHEEAKNTTRNSSHPPKNTARTDPHSAEGAVCNHTVNGVVHHQK